MVKFLKVIWRECRVPIGEFKCITGNIEGGVLAAYRANSTDNFKIVCLLSDVDHSAFYVRQLRQILTVTMYQKKVVVKYFTNRNILTEKVFVLDQERYWC